MRGPILMGLATLLAACNSKQGAPDQVSPAAPAAAGPAAAILALDQLEARVKQARGRGTLVNVWATW